jgi:hypothetical protein
MSELDDLIAEQARDMARGSHQSPEPGPVMHLGWWENVEIEGRRESPRRYRGCAIHGAAFMRRKRVKPTTTYCLRCQMDRHKERLATDAEYRERHRRYRREANQRAKERVA